MEFIQKVSDTRSKMYSKTIFLFSIASFLLLAVDVDTRSVELDEQDDEYSDELLDDELLLDDVMEPDEIDYLISEMEQKPKSKKKYRGIREKPLGKSRPENIVRNCIKWDLC